MWKIEMKFLPFQAFLLYTDIEVGIYKLIGWVLIKLDLRLIKEIM